MDIRVQKIGNYNFVTLNNEYVYAESSESSSEDIRENILFNFKNFEEMYSSTKKAYRKLINCTHAQKRFGWKDYEFQYDNVSLLEDMGFEVTLPLIDGFGKLVKLRMNYWKETEEGVFYTIGVFDRWSGTIIYDKDEESLREFFERFIGEVLYFTTLKDENYFPFVRDVRGQFNFRPALHSISL